MLDHLQARNRRFIPTCVGNIRPPFAHSLALPVHPHLRGEHANWRGSPRPYHGSSPPAWGTSGLCRTWTYLTRFIPTCVGNISVRWTLWFCLPVHPHLRGEHSVPAPNFPHTLGSSPPAWGTFIRRAGELAMQRFIPTCVGNIYANRI